MEIDGLPNLKMVEIDGLPIKNGGNRWFTELKHGDFPVRKASHITNF